jgi:hypothetical protein
MANATITAAVAEKTVQENNDAIVRFNLSSALTSSTTVKVSVNPQGGATTADYGTPPGALFYHMGILPGGWLSVPNDGVITINAGFTAFELKTNITNDTITEGYDSLAFTVAQTASSVGIADSWWVPSLVNLLDAVGTGAAATARTITAGATTTGVEGSATRAEATFAMGGSGGTYADTEVRVSMYGLGGATAADYTGAFQYDTGSGWLPVPGTGLITVGQNVASFKLGILAKTDTIAETGEAISFNAAQTTSSVGLVNSWWVPNIVDLQDAQGTGAVAFPRTITAGTTVTGVENSATPATATFNVSYDGGGVFNVANYADTEVRVSMYGLGGAAPADYIGDFQYNTGTGWNTVPGTGLISIPKGALSFQLAMLAKTDSIAETGEGISFNVAQTTSSVGLVNSWWVPNIVDLQDAQGTGAVAFPRTITAGAVVTGMEGSVTPASATFNVSYDGGGVFNVANYADTEVRVSMYGLGGAAPADYIGNFQYNTGAGWNTVPGTGLINIPKGALSFQLAMLAKTDSIAETGEAISFNVAQTTSSVGLVNSWWVQSTADLADVAAIYTVLTGAIGPDHFTATGATEMFVIPVGTSKASADGATGVVGGDPAAFTSGESFDTISFFTSGTDKIDLPPVATNTVYSFSPTAFGIALSEEALIAALQAPFGVALGATEIGRYTVGTNAYFLLDTGGTIGTWHAADDILIKIIGGSTVVVTDFV